MVCTTSSTSVVEKGVVVLRAGGVGMVLINIASLGNEIEADEHILPAIAITYSDGQTLLSYLKSNRFVHFIRVECLWILLGTFDIKHKAYKIFLV